MHILKIIHGYPPTYNAGSEVYSQSICNQLKKTNKISVFTREENLYLPDFKIRQQKKDNIDFFFANMARAKDGFCHLELDKKFSKIIEKIKPDVAHIGHLNHLSTGFIEILKEKKIPIIFTLHDFWLMCPRGQFLQVNFGNDKIHQLCDGQEDRKCATNCYRQYATGLPFYTNYNINEWKEWVQTRMNETRYIAQKIDIFIAPSQYLRNRFIKDFQIPEQKIIYLDYGFPLSYLQPIEKKQRDFYTFGYIGTHIPAKGVNILIEAFQKLPQEKVKLKIFGRENGQSTQYLKEISEGFNIEFCGEYINQNLAKVVFSEVDCIVVPSIWAENSPLVIHEAQACKIPVITTDFGGMAEYVQHLENGLLFEHRNTKDLTEKMLFASENKNLMNELGKKGYLYSENGEVPNIENHCQILEKIYQKIIQNYGI
ncbi:MAG: glycosyltransferase [Bacteroidetes bacterium]|nr:MAG: glycosyltransferase [Bacteroidota bacterium]TAG87222.1 MAG: glycosyltransferase [Bacteroidota bacterium]